MFKLVADIKKIGYETNCVIYSVIHIFHVLRE